MAHAETEVHTGPATSEGNVMLAAGLALVVAAIGFAAGSGGHAAAVPEAHVSQGIAEGHKGAVATASPEASRVALQVMEKGGNAFDALVAASFAVGVTRPQSTGIGGGGFCVWYQADDQTHGAYDGREMAPASARRTMYQDAAGNVLPRASLDGTPAGGVPGLVKMLHRLYEEHTSGALTWAQLLKPAIDLARHGFVVTEPLSKAIASRRQVLMRYAESSARVFLPDGRVPQPGDLLVQADLAQTLEEIAADPDSFYNGDLASRIADGVPEFTTQDLANYTVHAPEAVVGHYRGDTVISMPPPSSGGVVLVEMLNIISQDEQPLGSMRFQGPDHLHLLIEAMRRAYADRSEHLGDPYPGVGSKLPVAWLTSEAYAKQLYAGIDMRHATPSAQVKPGTPQVPEGDHTTHISIVDEDGNAVSSTQTINTWLGSGYVIPGTGILLNNEMDDFAAKPGASNYFGLKQGEKNAVAPGRRPLSSMTPTIVLGPDGKVRLVVGSPGGSKIITATMQVLINVVDFGMPLQEAVDAPRIHEQWLYKGQDVVFADPGLPKETLRELTRRGHVIRVGALDLGNVQAVEVQPDGTRVAVSDSRGTGQPSAY